MENKICSHPSKWRINGSSLNIFYGLTRFQLAEGGKSGCWSIEFLMKCSRENSRSGGVRWMNGTLAHFFRCTQTVLPVSAWAAYVVVLKKADVTDVLFLSTIHLHHSSLPSIPASLFSSAFCPMLSFGCPAFQITCTLTACGLVDPWQWWSAWWLMSARKTTGNSPLSGLSGVIM